MHLHLLWHLTAQYTVLCDKDRPHKYVNDTLWTLSYTRHLFLYSSYYAMASIYPFLSPVTMETRFHWRGRLSISPALICRNIKLYRNDT